MRQLTLTFLMLIAAVFSAKAQDGNYWLDEENQIVYQYYPGTGYAEVAPGTSHESDVFPQTVTYKNQIGEVIRIIESFEVNGEKFTVQTISGHPFFGLTKVKTVYLPKTIRRIDGLSFGGCSGIEDVYSYISPWNLVWATDTYWTYCDFKKDKGTKFHVHPDYYGSYTIRFGGNNVTFVGDFEYDDAEPEPKGLISYFKGYEASTGKLPADGNLGDWYLKMPNDGSTIELAADGYWGESGLYFRLKNGNSSWKDLTLTTDKSIHGTLRQILVWGAGGIHMLRYRLSDGRWLEKEFQNNGGWLMYNLDFDTPERIDGPVELHIYSETPFVIQNIQLVFDEQEPNNKYSTFRQWLNHEGVPATSFGGTILTDEGNIWTAHINPTISDISYTRLGMTADDGTSCLAFSTEEGLLIVNVSNKFLWSGPLKKIVIRAAGNIESLQLQIKDHNSEELKLVDEKVTPSNDFKDYVIRFPKSPDYMSAKFTISIKGSSPIFIHGITLFKEEEDVEDPTLGQCGDKLYYTLEYLPGQYTQDLNTYQEIPAAALVITGSGEMWDFDDEWSGGTNMVPWMQNRSNIVEVRFPESISSIGNNAFARLWNCQFSNLPNSVRRIGVNAFYNDMFGEQLILPFSLERIETDAFKAVNLTKRVYIPRLVSYIAPGAINCMYNVDNYDIDMMNQTYSDDGGCVIERATNKVIAGGKLSTIPEGVQAIGARAFEGCRRENITLPNSLKEIGDYAFYDSYISEIRVPGNVKTIGQYAFAQCKKLINASLGDHVESVGRGAFDNCLNMLDIKLYCKPKRLTWTSYSADARMFAPEKKTVAHVRWDDYDTWTTQFAFLNLTFLGDLINGIDPIYDTKHVDGASLTGLDLTDCFKDNVYYNLPASKGSGCINGVLTIGTVTDINSIGYGDPYSEEVRENFNGIILRVNGKGTFKIDAQAFGSRMNLAVRIGDGTPIIFTEGGRMINEISYNVAHDTYIYIYAVPGASLARGMNETAWEDSDDHIAIYGITVIPEGTAIQNLTTAGNGNNEGSDDARFDLNGRPVLGLPARGIMIHNGHKVLVK